MIRILAVLAAFVLATPAFSQALPAGLDKANAIVIDTTKGRVIVKLRTDLAPQHAERIKLLDALGVLRRDIGAQLDHNPALGGVDDDGILFVETGRKRLGNGGRGNDQRDENGEDTDHGSFLRERRTY